MPPSAPAIGSATCEGRDSSPSTTSRLISSPTSRKKNAISPSLIHSSSGLLSPMSRYWMVNLSANAACTASRSGELASTSARTAAPSRGKADAASLSMKALNRLTRVTVTPGPPSIPLEPATAVYKLSPRPADPWAWGLPGAASEQDAVSGPLRPDVGREPATALKLRLRDFLDLIALLEAT